MFGIKESVRVNNIVVCFKLSIILLVIFAGMRYINSANYYPFVPQNTGVYGQYGFSGVIQGAVSVFFAYIGFDSVTTVCQN
jgi:APA family basic amino acid/polyamine antiporter